MGILVLLGVICSIHAAYAATHSLKYLNTGVTAGTEFPEFTIVGMVDDEQFMYYDSNISKAIPRTQWIEHAEDKNYWGTETQRLRGEQQRFRAMVENVMQAFEQTQGVHVFQNMYGCEWDEETGATDGYNQHRYDGEDFLTFDVKNMQWNAPLEPALPFALRWNHNQTQIDYEKNYLTQECIWWLKKYVSYGRSTLERRVRPEVSLFQKNSSSPFVCHATGFFPRGIMVTWQRDGEEVQEDVEQGETLPNGDGTFQITSNLTVKPGDWKSHTYTCSVQHKSLEKDKILTEEDLNKIKTRGFGPGGDSDSSGPPMGIIIGCVVGALIVALAVIGVVMWKRRSGHECSAGYGKTSSSDTNSEASDSNCSIDSGHSDTYTESRRSNSSSESNDSETPFMKKRHT